MKKITLIVGTLLLAAVFPCAAQAQKEERSYRFGIETEPLLFSDGYTNVGAEFYVTDKVGIRVQKGNFDFLTGFYEYDGSYGQLGAAYYFAGVANLGRYVYAFAEVDVITIHSERNALLVTAPSSVVITFLGAPITEPRVDGTTTGTGTATGESTALILGGIVGHRWQGKRSYFRAGIGYGVSIHTIEAQLKTSDGAFSETHTPNVGGVVVDITLGMAF